MKEKYTSFEQLGYQWTVKPELAEFLREEIIPLLLSTQASPQDSPHVKVIRKKPARDSYLIAIPGAPAQVFAKVHGYARLKDRLKTIVRASRARAEWDAGIAMLKSGLPVPEPLALGERRSGGLITGCIQLQRVVPDCVAFSDHIRQMRKMTKEDFAEKYLKESPKELDEEASLRALGALANRMHSAGFWHPDLHTGNVLVEYGDALPKLWIVDLHSARERTTVSGRRRMADMAKVIYSLLIFIPESGLREMLGAYMPEAGEDEVGKVLARLKKKAAAMHRRHIRSRSKRCLKTSGGYVVERIDDLKLYRKRYFGSDRVLEAVRRHREICSSEKPRGAGLVKATPKRVVTAFRLGGEDGEKVYVKEFKNFGFVKLLETVFYAHTGRRAWKAGNRLKVLKILCPEMLALAEKSKSGVLGKSYIIMKEVPDAVQLDTYLVRKYFKIDGSLSREEILEKRRLVRAVANAVRKIHSKKVYNKDLSAKNLLKSEGPGGEAIFYLIDVDGVQFPPRISVRRRIKNLSQLNGMPGCITSTDKLRFYMEYFGLERLTPTHKLIIFVIRRISRRRVESMRRTDRRIRKQWAHGVESYEDPASL
jgi:tRNA A-37 threonylcarbamoyl transferase component Bud32